VRHQLPRIDHQTRHASLSNGRGGKGARDLSEGRGGAKALGREDWKGRDHGRGTVCVCVCVSVCVSVCVCVCVCVRAPCLVLTHVGAWLAPLLDAAIERQHRRWRLV
jgi:hypothetical protein